MSARLGKLVKHGDILSLSGCIMMRKGSISVLVFILTQLRVVLSKLTQPGGKNLIPAKRPGDYIYAAWGTFSFLFFKPK